MEKVKLISIIESGKQVGCNKIIKFNNKNMLYTYAVQKVKDKYIVYTDEVCLDTMYEDEDKITEKVFIYDNISEVINNNIPDKYNIQFKDLTLSKGSKFFYYNF